jgi:hypothetical protein
MYKNTFKKLNLITFLIFMLLVAFQTSCKEDDNYFNGTVWKGNYEDRDNKYESTITFKTITFSMTDKRIDSDYSFTYEGTYSYVNENITLYLETEDESDSVSGKVSGNKMTFPGGNGKEVIYTKQ